MKDIELVTALSKSMDMTPHKVLDTLSVLYTLIGDAISDGGIVNVNGIGQFEAKKKAERITANPSNGKRYLIPPKLTPIYKPAQIWKDYLKKIDEND
ncbi:MAG: HU family DNA-binding protein [Tannerella sp.]|jgi:DNA-binding protein HU-beta|nr:HU family DNA-binding protein [Tannerella sp.]